MQNHGNPAYADQENEESERLLLHRAMGSSRSGITIARASAGCFPLIYANPAFYRLTGYTPEEVMGQDCRYLRGQLRDQPGLHVLRAALAGGLEATVLLRNYRKDGSEFWNELTVSPVLGDGGVLTHYVGIQHDVTERENGIRTVAALNQALAHRSEELAQANESLRAFSSSASHDLRVPLTSIKGFCAVLKNSSDLPRGSRAAHYLARIEANAQHMGQLIEALLQLSQSTATPLNISHCDLSAMAHEALDTLGAAAQPAQLHIQPGLTAQGDPALLRSVLENLLGNALKYSSKTADASVQFGCETVPGSQRRFFVRDNGIGFDMAHAGKLFDAFERLHPQSDYPGTGVGLTTARRIIARHGGAIWAESAPGQGAVFYFTLD